MWGTSNAFGRRAFAAVLVLTMLAAGCSSGSASEGPAKLDLAGAISATEHLGIVRTVGTARHDGKELPISGTFDYRARRATARYPMATTSTFGSVALRRIGSRVWIHRLPTTKTIAIGPDLLGFRRPGERPWRFVDGASDSFLPGIGAADPVAVVREAMTRKLTFHRTAESETIGGKGASGFVAKIPTPIGNVNGIARLTVWVDGSQRIVRIEAVSNTGVHSSYDVTKASRSPKVSEPAAKDVEGNDQAPDAPSGPFVPVATGDAGGVAYQVLRAPSTTHGTCWKVESTPTYHATGVPAKDGSVCVPTLEPKGPEFARYQFAIDANDKTPYELFGILVPAGSTAEMTLLDGSRHPVPYDPGSGLVLYSGPATPVAVLMTVDLPGGPHLVCGPGPIGDRSDLAQLDPADVPDLRWQAWNCLPGGMDG